MKDGKSFSVVLMTVVLGVLFALNAAYAFEPKLCEDKWFKVTFEINGFCDIFLGELEKEEGKQVGYLYLHTFNDQNYSFDAYLGLFDEIEEQWEVFPFDLELLLGDFDDKRVIVRGQFIISDEPDPDQEMQFIAKLRIWENNGELVDAKLKSLAAFVVDSPAFEQCVVGLEITGKLKDKSKVPFLFEPDGSAASLRVTPK